MNAKTVLLAAAATLMTFTLAAQEHRLIAPITVVGAKQVSRVCHSMIGRAPKLSRADVAVGFGRPWTDDMEPLRVKANNDATDVCAQGYDGVSFTFIRGSGAHDLAISAGQGGVVASATP